MKAPSSTPRAATSVKATPADDHDHSGPNPVVRTSITAGFFAVAMYIELATDLFERYPLWRLVAFAAAYLPVALPVMREAWEGIAKRDFFTEFTLMTVATLGAFILGEYPEAVAVMLFYAVGELFQQAAVGRAKKSIKALLDVRPQTALVVRNGQATEVPPGTVQVGETVRVSPGGRVPLDGELKEGSASFNTAALTGESVPRTVAAGGAVLAGSIVMDRSVDVLVTKAYADSSLARMLYLVQHATAQKAPTELFIRRFARIYTPIVFACAVLLVLLPKLFVADYVFTEWFYRALIFLVIACPCALVISIPLGYFGGIGAASRRGILFKGSDKLDRMAQVNTVVSDKTGTLTEGRFKVTAVEAVGMDERRFLQLVASVEVHSKHPVALAVVEHAKESGVDLLDAKVEEIAGHGLRGTVGGDTVLAGNLKLMVREKIGAPAELAANPQTIVVCAVNGTYAGYITIADAPKPDAKKAVVDMRAAGVRDIIMLSGDKQSVTTRVAQELGIADATGDLLPEGKLEKVKAIKQDPTRVVAFIGDGINDAPVLAISDLGIAMGGLGSDAAIETADVVIQTDQPSRVAEAIHIARRTKRVVWQNIALTFGVKVVVLILGAGGLATMWEAVFADVGVSLIAILNAVRLLRGASDLEGTSIRS